MLDAIYCLDMGLLSSDKSKSYPITGLHRPSACQEVEVPRFQDIWHMKVVRLSATRSGRLYYPPPSPKEIFQVLISVRGWVEPQVRTALGRFISMKNSNDAIGNRNPDLPASSATCCWILYDLVLARHLSWQTNALCLLTAFRSRRIKLILAQFQHFITSFNWLKTEHPVYFHN
jgi:hypothetical protein